MPLQDRRTACLGNRSTSPTIIRISQPEIEAWPSCIRVNLFQLKLAAGSIKLAAMAALQFLGKYREGGLLLIRVSIGLMFIILIAPVLWSGQRGWEHFGSAMRHLDFHSHYAFWGFVGALAGCAGGLLMLLGLFFGLVFCSRLPSH